MAEVTTTLRQRVLDWLTQHVPESRVRHILGVEEMAIASGTPVPSVWVLEREPGVNAFAAGLTLDDDVTAHLAEHWCSNGRQLEGVGATVEVK